MATTGIYMLLSTLAGICVGDGILSEGLINGSLGGAVNFITTLTPYNFTSLSTKWIFGGIVITEAPQYRDRINLFHDTGSLELRNLSLVDTGEYRVNVTTNTGEKLYGTTVLDVYAPIAGAAITGPRTTLENSSISFTCDARGTINNTEWMKDGRPLTSTDRIFFSANGREVTINPVDPTDGGQYQCKLTNPIHSDTAAHELVVYYGPYNMTILGPATAEVDFFVLMYCKVDTVPPATFSWFFNGEDMGVHEAGYIIDQATFTHTGNYSCRASNSVTNGNSNMNHYLLVKDKSPSTALKPGEAAGIAVAVTMIVMVLIIVLVYFGVTQQWNKHLGDLWRRNNRHRSGREQRRQEHTTRNAQQHHHMTPANHDVDGPDNRSGQEQRRQEPTTRNAQQHHHRTPAHHDVDRPDSRPGPVYQNCDDKKSGPPLPPRNYVPKDRNRNASGAYEKKIDVCRPK